MNADFAVIGAGVVGLSIARALRTRYPDCSVVLLEKEPDVARHASGRNSGVLHAGFYYTADSLKARFCREGNRQMRVFCEDRRLAINTCGKLVVARTEADWPGLDTLYQRAQANGVRLERITEAEARSIEPRVRTRERALWSPDTATVDPAAVVRALRQDAEENQVHTIYNAEVKDVRTTAQSTTLVYGSGFCTAGYVINAAGLYADRVAHLFGAGKNYTLLPFKGLYLTAEPEAGTLNTNIYPVPDLRNPFLGVHFTVTVDKHLKIGPTAIPCLWREQYGGLTGMRRDELLQTLRLLPVLWFRAGFAFRQLALAEMRKYWRPYLVRQAAHLVDGVKPGHFRRWGRPGIRAQLIRLSDRQLEMDFVVERHDHSLHILNAVSPAFTCALPFADYVVGMLER